MKRDELIPDKVYHLPVRFDRHGTVSGRLVVAIDGGQWLNLSAETLATLIDPSNPRVMFEDSPKRKPLADLQVGEDVWVPTIDWMPETIEAVDVDGKKVLISGNWYHYSEVGIDGYDDFQ